VEGVVANRPDVDMVTFDPVSTSPNPDTPATGQVVVFMLGGGSWEERRNLSNVRGVKSLVYGCTEMCGSDVLQQLGQLE
jgi:hypothetical protein